MRSSRLFWKLFLSYALLNLAATVTFAGFLAGWQKEEVIKLVQQHLEDLATLVRRDVQDKLSAHPEPSMQQRIRQLGQAIETRITVVDIDGVVLADSSRATIDEVVEMENHSTRPELVQAKSEGVGLSQRTSPTLGVPMLYVALRADNDQGPTGLVRTALPMTELLADVAVAQRLIWMVAAGVSLAVLVLTYFVVISVVRPIGKLKQAAESIAAGDYQHRVFLESHDELGDLATSFNSMSDKLDAREQQLRASRQRLETVLEGMVEGVIALDERERIVLANAEAGRLLGFVPAEVEGRSLMEVVRNHTIHEVLEKIQVTREAQRTEIELGGDDPRVLNVYVTLLSGQPATRFVIVIQDVSDLRRLESLRQEFVANVSHELKTPLSSIKAYAETLMRGAINDEENNVRFLQAIEEQADRLHELILDMLRLARIESGQQAFDIGAVSLREVVRSCLEEHQPVAASKSINLTTSGDTPDLQLLAEEEGLRQILNNLIDNALKYTPDGGDVAVCWRQEDTLVAIDVRDTGIGIPTAHQPRVFERFYRVDKARSRKLGGTGLGLSIVKHLAQSFGGSVEVESQPGVGTVFTVRLRPS